MEKEQQADKKLKEFEGAMQPYLGTMGEAADAILDQDVSGYPLFVVHQLEVQIGIPIVVRNPEENIHWSINASMLEELATKQVINMEQVDKFRQVFKDPREELCLLLLNDLGANFIFMPRKKSE